MTKVATVVNGKGGAPKVEAKNTKPSEAKEIKAKADEVKAEAEAKSVTRELPKMTVEERFNKLEEFQALQVRHSKIKAKHQSLKVLKRSNDTLGAEISISAGSEEITLNNGAIVSEVLDLLTKKLEALNTETENEVLSFVI